MSLIFSQHKDFEAVTREFANIDKSKQDAFTFSTRAPTSSDKGFFWIAYDDAGSPPLTLYIRSPQTGTWRSAQFT